MGSGGAKQTNRLLEEQRQRSNRIADTASGRSAEQYNQVAGLPSEILGHYRGMLGGLNESGTGLPGYSPMKWESTALPFFQEMMNTGGYSEADKANILSYATGPISGMFDALSRQLSQARAGRGLTYSSGSSRLARDKAYESSHLAKGVAGDLAERIIANRLKGGQGTAGLEQQRRQFLASERGKARGARASANSADFARKMALLSAMGKYAPGTDIQYMDRSLAGTGQGTGAAGARRDETPAWQKMFTGLIPNAFGAGIGAFGGGGRRNRSMPTPQQESWTNLNPDEWNYMGGR